MGDGFAILPLTADPGIPPWLEQHGITVPPITATNRYPSLRELRAVLAQLDGYAVTYRIGPEGCDIDIVGAKPSGETTYACIWTRGFQGDEAMPLEFSFHKGWPDLNLEITRRVSEICGPLVFVSYSVGVPIVVTPDINIHQALTQAGYL
jgi:hypothetical protein